MAAASAITTYQGSKQLGGVWSELWLVSCTLDAGNLINAAGETDTVAVPGVALGDMVIGISFNKDLVGITVTGFVSTAGVVTLRIQNEGEATTDLASATLKLVVGRPAF